MTPNPLNMKEPGQATRLTRELHDFYLIMNNNNNNFLINDDNTLLNSSQIEN